MKLDEGRELDSERIKATPFCEELDWKEMLNLSVSESRGGLQKMPEAMETAPPPRINQERRDDKPKIQ